MGGGQSSFDVRRLEAALGSAPKRFEIHASKLAAKRAKAWETVRLNVQTKPKTVWADNATFAAREHYIVRARETAFLKLVSHCRFLTGSIGSLQVGDLPPAGTKQSMDTILWAAMQCPEIDELAVVGQELKRRYGERKFKAAMEHAQGHEVDPEVYLRLGHASANPSTELVRQEVLDICAVEPKLELDPKDLMSTIGSGGSGGGGRAGGAAGAASLPELPLAPPPPPPSAAPQYNIAGGGYGGAGEGGGYPPAMGGGGGEAPGDVVKVHSSGV